jgi:hypothetical protein
MFSGSKRRVKEDLGLAIQDEKVFGSIYEDSENFLGE